MDRRIFLKSSGLFLAGQFLLPRLLRHALAQSGAVATAGAGARDKVLVVIFQRGAVDGLSMVPPVGDSHYSKEIRPTIALSAGGEQPAVALDGFFALHPALKPLEKYWKSGNLAVLHQVGSPDPTRSHFDAQDLMESGTPGVKSTEDGFLNRALLILPTTSGAQDTTFRGVALQPNLPRMLWGSSGAFAMNSLQEFSKGGALMRSGVGNGFESLYESAMDEALRGAGQRTFKAFKTLADLPESKRSVEYPKSPLGNHLGEIARLIRGRVGLRVAVTDCGGWDTHQRQGAGSGQLAGQLKNLGESIAAFAEDLDTELENVCLVTMTEFGRTVRENGNGGTDHGHGSVMLVLGGEVRGKRVLSHWKSLAPQNLFEGRDLPVTTDFRDVWREILAGHLGVKKLDTIFPNYAFGPGVGLFRS